MSHYETHMLAHHYSTDAFVRRIKRCMSSYRLSVRLLSICSKSERIEKLNIQYRI